MEFFLNLLRSVAYGIIEGVTEWLPISQYRPHDPSGAGS